LARFGWVGWTDTTADRTDGSLRVGGSVIPIHSSSPNAKRQTLIAQAARAKR